MTCPLRSCFLTFLVLECHVTDMTRSALRAEVRYFLLFFLPFLPTSFFDLSLVSLTGTGMSMDGLPSAKLIRRRVLVSPFFPVCSVTTSAVTSSGRVPSRYFSPSSFFFASSALRVRSASARSASSLRFAASALTRASSASASSHGVSGQ